jgi:nucleotide-binding universal stress UspA family protein
MTESQQPAQRILVVCDTSQFGLAALENAANLAADLRAELQGLFVEDVNLLRLAGLPFASEIGYALPRLRKLDVASMEEELRAKATRLHQAIEESARRASVQWSFTVVRGHVTRAMLEAAANVEYLVLGRESTFPADFPGKKSRSRKLPLVVLCDDSEASRRALRTAALLNRNDSAAIVVLLDSVENKKPDELRQHCDAWLKEVGLTATYDNDLISDADSLINKVNKSEARMLLISRKSRLLDDATVEALADQLNCPILLVG